jgi:hypothetical protein
MEVESYKRKLKMNNMHKNLDDDYEMIKAM